MMMKYRVHEVAKMCIRDRYMVVFLLTAWDGFVRREV